MKNERFILAYCDFVLDVVIFVVSDISTLKTIYNNMIKTFLSSVFLNSNNFNDQLQFFASYSYKEATNKYFLAFMG